MRGTLAATLFLLLCNVPAFAAEIQAEITNRFRLFENDAQQSRFLKDLEQRLKCTRPPASDPNGDCSERLQIRKQPTQLNYWLRWDNKTYRFEQRLIHDRNRTIRLSVSGMGLRRRAICAWTIDGEEYAGETCAGFEHVIQLDPDRMRRAKISARVTSGEQTTLLAETEFVFADKVIATIGDSFISGEGNPQIDYRIATPQSPEIDGGKRAQWLDVRCHRSLFTGALIAAIRFARENKQISVTFLPLACSGATFREGILGRYIGRETPIQANYTPPGFTALSDTAYFRTRRLPSQIDSLKIALCETAELDCPVERVQPDVLIVSGGGNDIGFGDIVDKLAKQKKVTLGNALGALPGLYRQFNREIVPFKARQVFAIGYMDPTERGPAVGGQPDYCTDTTAQFEAPPKKTFVPRFATLLGYGINEKGARFAKEKVLIPLNAAFSKASAKHHWRFITVPEEKMQGHGYCSEEAWFHTYGSSWDTQGFISDDTEKRKKIGGVPSGALHPNIYGHDAMAREIFRNLAETIAPRPADTPGR